MGKIKHELYTFGKAEVTASMGSAVDFGLAFMLSDIVGIYYGLANALGVMAGGVTNCCLNYRYVFGDSNRRKRSVAWRYFIVWAISWLLNSGGTIALTEFINSHERLDIHYLIPKSVVSILVALLVNYPAQRKFVFKPAQQKSAEENEDIELSQVQKSKKLTKTFRINNNSKNMNYRDFLQKVIYVIINPIIKAMIRLHITPNIVTFIGFIGNIVAAGFFVEAALTQSLELLGWGGLIILAAGLFDMMDGRLARMSGKSSLFGALWDSTLDRYSELVSLFGICLYFLRMQDETGFWMGIVTFAAMIGSVMVSYVRARAEGLDIECKVGLMQRPERVVVTAVTAMFTGCMADIWWLAGGMILIAVLANITAFWRIAHCYIVMNKKEAE